jgi:hypothetical protein
VPLHLAQHLLERPVPQVAHLGPREVVPRPLVVSVVEEVVVDDFRELLAVL